MVTRQKTVYRGKKKKSQTSERLGDRIKLKIPKKIVAPPADINQGQFYPNLLLLLLLLLLGLLHLHPILNPTGEGGESPQPGEASTSNLKEAARANDE
jgi:hypothetical protein